MRTNNLILALTLAVSGCSFTNSPIKITNDPSIKIGDGSQTSRSGSSSNTPLQKPSSNPLIQPVEPPSQSSDSGQPVPDAPSSPAIVTSGEPSSADPISPFPLGPLPGFQFPPESVSQPTGDPSGSLEVGISAEAPPPLDMATQATKQDIHRFRLTIGGDAIIKAEGKPRVLELFFNTNQAKTWFPAKRLPVGFVEVDLEAFDSSGQKISDAKVTQVPIRSGKTTRQRIHLRLIDTVVDEPDNPAGNISMDVVITDGRKIIRKSAVIPEGGFLTLEGGRSILPPPPTRCQEGVPDFTESEALLQPPVISEPEELSIESNLPIPNLADLSGSSAGNGLDVFEGIGSGMDLTGASTGSLPILELPPQPPCIGDNLTGSSVSNQQLIASSSPQLTQLHFAASRMQVKAGESVDLLKRLALRYSDGQRRIQGMSWNSSASAVVQVDNNGLAKALKEGNSIISVQLDGKQATLNLLVRNSVSVLTPRVFQSPHAELSLSVDHLKPGDRLVMKAQNSSGSIQSYFWQVSNNLLQVQTLQPQTELVVWQPGQYTVQLYLKGTNGKIYSASNPPQKIVVKSGAN